MRAVLLGFFAALACASALAQAPTDPGVAATQARFEALSPAARVALQRDLVWTGGFAGNASGEFGVVTYASLRRFEQRARLGTDATFSPAGRALLAKAADAARAAAGFRVEQDKASGMRIGVPTKLLTKRSLNPAGLDRWQDADGRITLDLALGKPEDTLPVLFEKGTDARVAGRRITYKLLRPTFFVISGETEKGKFYRRMEKTPEGLRGFALGYDKALAATVDPVVVTIATTFETRPGALPAPTQAIDPPGQQATAPPTPPVVQAPPRRKHLTGVIVVPGKILTAEAPYRTCKVPTLDSPNREALAVERADTARGLVLLAGAHPGARALQTGAGSVKVLLQRDGAGKLTAGPASASGTQALAPLQEGGAGAALLDAGGGLAGIIIGEPLMRYAVAGTIPALRYAYAPGSEIAAFLGSTPTPASAAALSAGDVAEAAGASVVSILCAQ